MRGRREGRGRGEERGGERGEGRGEEAFLVMWPRRLCALNPPLQLPHCSGDYSLVSCITSLSIA